MTLDMLYLFATSLAMILLVVVRFRGEPMSRIGLLGGLVAAVGLTLHGFLGLLVGQGQLSQTAWTIRVVSAANTSVIMGLLLNLLIRGQWRRKGGSGQHPRESEIAARSQGRAV